MGQDEYNYKIQTELSKSIMNHVRTLSSIVIRNYTLIIASVEGVDVKANIANIKLHNLLSGNEVEINVEGIISLFETKDGGSLVRYVTFWVRPAKVKFSLASENFDVVDISKFLPLDF